MFDFFDRIKEYQCIERDNPDSNWKRWEALNADEISDNYYVITARDNDKRKLFVSTFIFSENNFTYGNEQDLIEEKRKLIQKIIILKTKSKYFCQVDYGSIQEIKDNNEIVGYDALLRYEPLMSLTEFNQENKSVQNDEINDTVINIIKNIAYALKQMEAENLSHGHINPSNIFVEQENNSVKYILGIPMEDWFKKTDEDSRRNVDNYTAPELVVDRNIPFNICSDIYSLGLVAYQILNDGKIPFETDGVSHNEAYKKLCSGEDEIPFPVHGSDPLKYIVRKACANDVEDRYKSIDELLNDLSETNQTVLNVQFEYLSNPANVCTISRVKKEQIKQEELERQRQQEIKKQKEIEKLIKIEKQKEAEKQNQVETKRRKKQEEQQQVQQKKSEINVKPDEQNELIAEESVENIKIELNDGEKKGCCLWSFLKAIIIIGGLIFLAVIIFNFLFGNSKSELDNSIENVSYSTSTTEQITKNIESESESQSETEIVSETQAETTVATTVQTYIQTTVKTELKTAIAITSNIPSSFESIHTYEFISGKYTWEEAKIYCEQHGGKLATIHSSDDWNSLISVVDNARSKNNELQYVWLGATSTLNTNNMTLSFSWIDNSDTSYIMGSSFNHWYYNSKMGLSEPSGYDAYSYQKTGDLIREPYLMLWYVSPETGSAGQKEWSLNDICDVSNYPNYKDNNMGFVMEKETTVEVNNYSVMKTGIVVTQQDDLNVRSDASLSAPKIGSVKKGSTVNIIGETDGWYKIEYNGSYGYVSSDYLSIT